jgi:signal transduction histidine kinase
MKTPIAVLVTEAQTLHLEDQSDEIVRFVRSVEEEMLKLGQLVDSFLVLTRVREERAPSGVERLAVNDLVMDSLDDCQSLAMQYRVYLEPELIAEEALLDASVRGDPHLLRTMLNNLIRNAIRFSPECERVKIRAVCRAETVEISVRDRGSGIPEDLIDRIFDRFAQADGEKRRGRGHGLGLEIAQGIAELHDGFIEVRNCDDGGCAFTIRLPRAQPVARTA